MTRRFLLMLDLNSDEVDGADMTIDDVTDALRARLGPEACYDNDGNPIHGRLVSAADITDATQMLLYVLGVGVDTMTDADEFMEVGLDPKEAETLEVVVNRFTQDLTAQGEESPLCADCGRPIRYSEARGWYEHIDPTASCFLIGARE